MSWTSRNPYGGRRGADDPDWTDTMQVCENGHLITAFAASRAHERKRRCPDCGAGTLTACPGCAADIPGHRHRGRVLVMPTSSPPAYCENCGGPFPWTGKQGPAAAAPSGEPGADHVLAPSVVAGTRTYLEQIVAQANGCYRQGWYDACSVMVRKLVEVLLIAAFEAKGEAEAVKQGGNFPMLSGLIDAALTRPHWNLGRETRAALPLVKSLGDRAAHNRHYVARKEDVDRISPGLRVAVEDLLHQADLVR